MWSDGEEPFDIRDENLQPRPGDVCELPPFVAGAEARCTPPEYDWWAMMAVATHFVNKLDALPGSPLSGEELDFVILYNAPGYGFYRSDLRKLALGPGASRHRFLVGHEMGHWIQSRTQVDEGGPSGLRPLYTYPAVCHESPAGPDPACQFAVVYDQPSLDSDWADYLKGRIELHGIRSSEYSSAAMVEGFAHFASSAAFNDIEEESGEFVYYKDIDVQAVTAYESFVENDGYRVDLPGSATGLGGTVGWVDAQCENDWSTLFGDDAEQFPTAVSSEIDWLRFFWAFLTSQDPGIAPKPGFWQVPQLISHALIYDENPWGAAICPLDAFGEARVWEPIVNTLGTDPGNAGLDAFHDRFVELNNTHEVWNDPN
jgi:hypothetical protein